MQDMTKSICDLTANEQQTTLVDIRDNKTYTIFKSKAPDSKCWMNQNLDLDLSSSITLTNQNTDLNSVNSWKPDRSTLTSDNFNSTNWKDDFNTHTPIIQGTSTILAETLLTTPNHLS